VDARQQAAADAIHTAARDRDARVGRRSTPQRRPCLYSI
jgi:hypothetical protein